MLRSSLLSFVRSSLLSLPDAGAASAFFLGSGKHRSPVIPSDDGRGYGQHTLRHPVELPAFPGVDVALSIGNTRQVVDAVVQGTADLGFVEGPFADGVVERLALPGDALTLVVGPQHAWADCPSVDISEFPQMNEVYARVMGDARPARSTPRARRPPARTRAASTGGARPTAAADTPPTASAE